MRPPSDLVPHKDVSPPLELREVTFDIALDRPDFLTFDFTPQRVKNIIAEAEDGDLEDWLELAEIMETRDTHIGGELAKRRLAITGLEWRVSPQPEAQNAKPDKLAVEAAKSIDAMFRKIPDVSEKVNALVLAIGAGVASVEKIFRGSTLVDLNPVPQVRHCIDWNRGPAIQIVTKSGVSIRTARPSKYIVYTPHSAHNRMDMRRIPLVSCAYLWLFKGMLWRAWAMSAEMFGMPLRVLKHPGNADEKVRRVYNQLLAKMGTTASITMPESYNIEFHERSVAGEAPYKPGIDQANGEISKRILGQTLTTEVGDSGSRALGDVHAAVAAQIRGEDRRTFSRAMTPTLAQLTRLNFGPDAPVPRWEYVGVEGADLETFGGRVATALAAGLPLSKKQLQAQLEFDEPQDDADRLTVLPAGLPSPTVPGPPIGMIDVAGRRLKDIK